MFYVFILFIFKFQSALFSPYNYQNAKIVKISTQIAFFCKFFFIRNSFKITLCKCKNYHNYIRMKNKYVVNLYFF